MRNYITNYDPFFDRFFLRANNCSTSHMMKTDIKENKSDYQMFIELPEVKKEDTRITLENGYLKVTATLNKEDQDISAKLENGVLTVDIKKRSEKEIEKEHLVQIA